MLDFEYKLLAYIKAHQPCSRMETLKAVRPHCGSADLSTLGAHLAVCSSPHGWVETTCADDDTQCFVRLTPKGESALAAAEKVLHKLSEQS